jgi:hypothetical protein
VRLGYGKSLGKRRGAMIENFRWRDVIGVFGAWLVIFLLATLFIAVHLGRASEVGVSCFGNEPERWCYTWDNETGETVQLWNTAENRRRIIELREQLKNMGTRGLIAIDRVDNPKRWIDI